MQQYGWMVLTFTIHLLLAGLASAEVRIVEVLADPPNDSAGDVNRDGRRSAIEDEFVELHNTGASSVDLSGWSLSDAAKVRHTFATATQLGAGDTLVIFGGGAPARFTGQVVTASGGTLSLNNHGDVLTLRDASMAIMDSMSYGDIGDQDQSLVRNGHDELVLHTSLEGASGALFSPGFLLSD